MTKIFAQEYWDIAEDACIAVAGKDWEWFEDCVDWMTYEEEFK